MESLPDWRSRASTITGTIFQINVSKGGIPKRAIAEAYLATTGVDGDSWAHPKFHGGPQQAVLLITCEGLDELSAQSYPVYPGGLGENLTTVGLDRRAIRIGDRFQAGEAIVEITKLRVPCATLNVFNTPGLRKIQAKLYDDQVKAGNSSSPLWGLSGFYARVLQPGLLRTGDSITKSV